MEVRRLEHNDYDMLVGWWKDWRWTPPTREMLPENGKGGILVLDDSVPVCAGFMYQTNSGIAWIEFIISNFQYKDKAKRAEAITYLVEVLTNMAKVAGFTICYSISMNASLSNIFKASGYKTGATNFVELIKKI